MARIHPQEYCFCPRCGGPLVRRRLKPQEPERLVCSQCQRVFYLDPKVAVIGVVPLAEGVVLVRENSGPRADLWALPGGFVDLGEPLETALIREVWEETRLCVRVERLLHAFSYPGQQTIILAYITSYLSGVLSPNGETREVRVFPPRQIPWDQLAFRTTQEALRAYLAACRS
ncbi:MAG: NUDIX domain-containing protein [Desulfobacca sp.]|uniref:NUDIX domain-containing protein n=1 Tax=Desulfobacca sp. TaxID=2067990 RepID=UPI00404AE1BF